MTREEWLEGGQLLLPRDDGPLPAALVIGEPELALEWARRLATTGHVVLVPAPGAGGDRERVTELGRALDALEARPEVDRERVAAVGLGDGGTLAFLLGCARRLAAVVDVEGPVLYRELSPARPIQPLELALNLEGRFLGCFASAGRVPAAELELLGERLSSAARPHDIVVFTTVGEELLDPRRPGFEEPWRRVVEFLEETD